MSAGYITLSRCWPCMTDGCYKVVTPHTWMDAEDIAHALATGQQIPTALVTDRPCACWCAGGLGPHTPLPEAAMSADDRNSIQRAVKDVADQKQTGDDRGTT